MSSDSQTPHLQDYQLKIDSLKEKVHFYESLLIYIEDERIISTIVDNWDEEDEKVKLRNNVLASINNLTIQISRLYREID